jgi:hypothetical protein
VPDAYTNNKKSVANLILSEDKWYRRKYGICLS